MRRYIFPLAFILLLISLATPAGTQDSLTSLMVGSGAIYGAVNFWEDTKLKSWKLPQL